MAKLPMGKETNINFTYNADTDRTVEENRKAAMIVLKNKMDSYGIHYCSAAVRYSGGFIYLYNITKYSVGGGSGNYFLTEAAYNIASQQSGDMISYYIIDANNTVSKVWGIAKSSNNTLVWN